MKKGFTMIELIFVIVILGILAAVAIPRLAATRDDAEISKAASNMATLVGDVGGYYTAQGIFSTFANMTQVKVDSDTNTSGTYTASFPVKKVDCIDLTADANGTLTLVANGTNINNNICKGFFEIPEFKILATSGKDIKHNFGGSKINR